MCTYNSRDGVLTFTPDVVKLGGTIVAKMASPSGVTWTWTDLPGLTAQNCAPSAATCSYLATALTGTPGSKKWVIGDIHGGSVQGVWDSAQAYEVVNSVPTASSGILDVRGLWDGYYIQPGGAKYHNPVNILTENFSTGALTGTDNGTDGAADSHPHHLRSNHLRDHRPAGDDYSAQVSWTLSDDGTKLIAGGITDPTAPTRSCCSGTEHPSAPQMHSRAALESRQAPPPSTRCPPPRRRSRRRAASSRKRRNQHRRTAVHHFPGEPVQQDFRRELRRHRRLVGATAAPVPAQAEEQHLGRREAGRR